MTVLMILTCALIVGALVTLVLTIVSYAAALCAQAQDDVDYSSEAFGDLTEAPHDQK